MGRVLTYPDGCGGPPVPPPMVPAEGPGSGMSEGLRQQDKEVDLVVNPGRGKT